jgi:hypothetical protein
MTTTPKALFEAKFAEVTETSQYAANNCKASIDKLTATNVGTSNETITFHIIPPAGTLGPSNAVTKQLAPGATWPFPELVGHILENGGALSSSASNVGKIWIRGSGREFS